MMKRQASNGAMPNAAVANLEEALPVGFQRSQHWPRCSLFENRWSWLAVRYAEYRTKSKMRETSAGSSEMEDAVREDQPEFPLLS